MSLDKKIKFMFRINILMFILSCIFAITAFYNYIYEYNKYGWFYEVETIINGVSQFRVVQSYQNLILAFLLFVFVFGCLYNLGGWRELSLNEFIFLEEYIEEMESE